MALFLSSWLLELCAVLTTLCAGVYLHFTISYQYWKKKGIPYEEPSFPFGNMYEVTRQRLSLGAFLKRIYDKFDGHKLVGTYQLSKPALLLRDPEEIKRFIVKDFQHFHDRGIYADEIGDPLTAHLFTMEGTKWKNLRAKLTPTFTSGKMKMMFPTFAQCGDELKAHLLQVAESKDTIEVKELSAKYTTNVIASCAFGIQTNSLSNPDSKFHQMGNRIFKVNFLRNIRLLLGAFIPKLAALSKIPLIPRDISDFFRGVVNETITYREDNNVSRNDFMQLLMALKDNKPIDNDNNDDNDDDEEEVELKPEHKSESTVGLTIDQVAAQAFIFFFAGFETSSTLMSFCLYELALNTDIQDRLREEVDESLEKHGGVLTYEAVQRMEYMDQVVAETLRKYPPAPLLLRKCTKDYKLDDFDATIDRGTSVIISILGLHHDPKYYPKPDRFDPERFTAEAKSKRHHYAYLPFGEGPRICIGSRFGLLQTKVGLASLLSAYQFQVCKTTAIPLVMERKSLFTAAEGGINLQITPRP